MSTFGLREASDIKVGDLVGKEIRSRVDRICNKLHEAMDMWGTDEEAVYAALDEANEYGILADVKLWYNDEQYGEGESLEEWIEEDFNESAWWGAVIGGAIGVLVGTAFAAFTGGIALAVIPVLKIGGAVVMGSIFGFDRYKRGEPSDVWYRYYAGMEKTKSNPNKDYWTTWLYPKEGWTKSIPVKKRKAHLIAYRLARALHWDLIDYPSTITKQREQAHYVNCRSALEEAAESCMMSHVLDAFFVFFGHTDRTTAGKNKELSWHIDRCFKDKIKATKLKDTITNGEERFNCSGGEVTTEPIPAKGKADSREDETPADAFGADGSAKKPWERDGFLKTNESFMHSNFGSMALMTAFAATDLAPGAAGSMKHASLSTKIGQAETSSDPVSDTANTYNNASAGGEITGGGPATGQSDIDSVDTDSVDNFSGKGGDSANAIKSMTTIKALQDICDLLLRIGALFPHLQGKIMYALQKALNGDMSALLAMCRIICTSDLTDPLITELQALCKTAADQDPKKLKNQFIQSQIGNRSIVLDDSGNAIIRKDSSCTT
jgi:hypothetical protein